MYVLYPLILHGLKISSICKSLMTRQVPYPSISNFSVSLAIHQGILPDFSKEIIQSLDRSTNALRLIISRCWNRDVDRRPDMGTIAKNLEDLLASQRGQD